MYMHLKTLRKQFYMLLLIPLTSFSIDANDDLLISGFGNISAFKSGSKDFGFIYDLTKEGLYDEWSLKTGSSFGLQLNAHLNDSFSFVLQGVVQDKINNNLNNSINWAFIQYKASSALAMRAGRIATPIYMLSEYRNVGFAYLWTKPITDFYSSIPITYIDGGDITFNYQLGSGIFESKIFGGASKITIETVFDNYDVTLSPMLGAKFIYHTDDWFFSAVGATTKVKKGEPASALSSYLTQSPQIALLWPTSTQLISDFKFTDSRISYFSLGALYETGHWNIQTELSYTKTNWMFFPDIAAGYASIGRSFNKTSFYGFASKSKSVGNIYSLEAPPSPSLAISEIATAYRLIDLNLKSRIIDQETLGVGVRYDFNHYIAFKGQIERTWLKGDHSGGWAAKLSSLDKVAPDYINTLSFSMSFIF